MSKFGCTCGHVIRDQTDFLPYKAHIREDEDTQKPVELMADLLAQYMEAHQRGEDADFIRQFEHAQGNQTTAEWQVKYLADKPLSATIFHLIFDFWANYDRVIYECEACGRLWIEMDDNHLIPYLPETDARHVLRSRRNHHPYGYLDG